MAHHSARILILHSIKMPSVAFAALALALALAVGGASAQEMEGMPGGWSECPTPYEMGFGGDKIGYIIANTYDYAEQSPKCEAPGTKNGPKGAVDPNSFDTQNIIECHQQVTNGAAAANTLYPSLLPTLISALLECCLSLTPDALQRRFSQGCTTTLS